MPDWTKKNFQRVRDKSPKGRLDDTIIELGSLAIDPKLYVHN